ncbi:hypothetical protein DFH29DRAFT_1008154 [Suillus ampliporus]|nr:hypothetical protein DFH29DRAFT_1008154 [Suillus ampliporus]
MVPFDRSTPAWPTQLGRYAQKARQAPPLVPDFLVQEMQFDDFRHNVYGKWEEHIHPSGATYYYNKTWNTYTGLNVRDCPKVQLENFEAWVASMRGRVKGDPTIVAEPARTQHVDGDVYLYYLVAPDAHIIGWLEPLDGAHLFRECDFAREWNHKRLELEAQFWKHVEFFPHNFKLNRFLVRKLRTELDCADALTLDNSTSATIFSNKEATEKIISRLASLDDLTGSDGNITEPGVALFGRTIPHATYVSHVSYQLPEYTQITLAGVIMVVDAGFLAVQGVGTGMVAESILKGSIIFCVGCMFTGMFVQHFGEKLKMLRFAAYYLDQGGSCHWVFST